MEARAGMRFVMLGSGAVRDNVRRAGPSQALLVDGETWVFDCGRSACTNLARAGIPCETVDRVFLTHLHFDHVVDLPYLVYVGWVKERAAPLQIYGPQGTKDFVERIIRPPFEQDIQSRLGHGKDLGTLDPEVTDVEVSNSLLTVGDTRLSAISMTHANMPTLAFRVDSGDRRVVVTGDGIPGEGFSDFCRGADLLVIECSGTAEFLAEQPWGSWHMTPPGIASVAQELNVKKVMIKHLVMEDITGDRTAPYRMADQIREGYGGEVIVGEDLLELDI